MTLEEYIEEIKLELTGGVLELEITDEQIGNLIKKSFREIQLYIDETKLITIPFSSCIDTSKVGIETVTSVYRTDASDTSATTNGLLSPSNVFSTSLFTAGTDGSSILSLSQYISNYAAYNTYNQIKNSVSTDLSFKFDKQGEKLYINVSTYTPNTITIEYVPTMSDVSDIKTKYWIDVLYRLSLALVKIALGRIRTRFSQSNSIWSQDGETMLNEGNEEIKTIREMLQTNNQLSYPID